MPGKPDLRCSPLGSREEAAWPVVLSAVLLAAAVAAAVTAATVRFTPKESPRIASVRLADMTAAYVVKAAGEESPGEAAAADARRWAAALESAMASVAERQGAVLLPARAVAAGAPDLTAEVEAALSGLLAGSATGSPAGPSESYP